MGIIGVLLKGGAKAILENLDTKDGIDLGNGLIFSPIEDMVVSATCEDCGVRMNRYYNDDGVFFECPICGERVDYEEIAEGRYPSEDYEDIYED